MQIAYIKKYIITIFTIMLTCSCSNEQTFIVMDIIAPDNIPKKHIQEARKTIIGTKIHLLFSDNDVRMTIKIKEKKTESIVLQKIGENLYREEDGPEVFDLELKTIFGYVKSCKVTIYDKKRASSSMVWDGTMILKRK